MIVNKNNWTNRILEFAIQVDHNVKIRENEKRDKYRDHARELEKNYRNYLKLILIRSVNDMFDTIPKSFEKVELELEIRGQVETIEITALLKSAWKLRKVRKNLGILLSLKLQGKTISYY